MGGRVKEKLLDCLWSTAPLPLAVSCRLAEMRAKSEVDASFVSLFVLEERARPSG